MTTDPDAGDKADKIVNDAMTSFKISFMINPHINLFRDFPVPARRILRTFE
jgi:hypothetical protein